MTSEMLKAQQQRERNGKPTDHQGGDS